MALTVGGGAAKLSGENTERRSSLALGAGARVGALAMSGRQLWLLSYFVVSATIKLFPQETICTTNVYYKLHNQFLATEQYLRKISWLLSDF